MALARCFSSSMQTLKKIDALLLLAEKARKSGNPNSWKRALEILPRELNEIRDAYAELKFESEKKDLQIKACIADMDDSELLDFYESEDESNKEVKFRAIS